MTDKEPHNDALDRTARDAASREKFSEQNPEPSLGRRFGQIGVLGWMIIIPVLIAVLAGRWLDNILGTGITMTAAMTMAGAALGMWLAFRWMHDQ